MRRLAQKIFIGVLSIAVIALIIVSCIRVTPSEETTTQPSTSEIDQKKTIDGNIRTFTIQEDGVTYRIFYDSDGGFDFTEIEVVNVTKDKLEMELMQEQLEDIRGY